MARCWEMERDGKPRASTSYQFVSPATEAYAKTLGEEVGGGGVSI